MPNKQNFSWNKGSYLVYFTSPGCGYCTDFASTWENTVNELDASSTKVNTLKVSADEYDIAKVSPEVFGYPTIRAYQDGKSVADFVGERNKENLLNFVNTHFSSTNSQTGGGRRKSRRASLRRRSIRRSFRKQKWLQRGGMAPVSFVGAPMDTTSTVPPAQQSVNPNTALPPPAPHGGLYHPTAPPAQGGWGSIPVPPTQAGYINENLQSANPPPGATTQYTTGGTNRPGNSYSAKPGVHKFMGGDTHTLKCTNDSRGGKRRKNNRSYRKSRRNRHLKGGGNTYTTTPFTINFVEKNSSNTFPVTHLNDTNTITLRKLNDLIKPRYNILASEGHFYDDSNSLIIKAVSLNANKDVPTTILFEKGTKRFYVKQMEENYSLGQKYYDLTFSNNTKMSISDRDKKIAKRNRQWTQVLRGGKRVNRFPTLMSKEEIRAIRSYNDIFATKIPIREEQTLETQLLEKNTVDKIPSKKILSMDSLSNKNTPRFVI